VSGNSVEREPGQDTRYLNRATAVIQVAMTSGVIHHSYAAVRSAAGRPTACKYPRAADLSANELGARHATWSCQMRAKVTDYSDVYPVQGQYRPRSVNRRLSLPSFEPWTCHHQRKRTLSWEEPG